MLGLSKLHTFGLAGLALWSLITWCIAAGLVDKFNGYYDSANAVLAWGLISWIWYLVYLGVLLFVSTTTWATAIIVEIGVAFFLFVFGIGSVGATSRDADAFRYWGGSRGSLGNATLAFGWILVIAQLAYLVFLIVYLAMRHGFSQQTLRQSFHDLAEYGSGAGTGGGVEKPTELSSVPAPAPVTSAA